ncbi:MAG: hypothetical protein FJZ16_08015, partial [Candidatus Omnitrophica bacterium]|nr:hypothetical protein [Candidatus Omnitrophota bacterium]
MLIRQFVGREDTPKAEAFRQHLLSGEFAEDFWSQFFEPGVLTEREAEEYRGVWTTRFAQLRNQHAEVDEALRLIDTLITPLVDNELSNLEPAVMNALQKHCAAPLTKFVVAPAAAPAPAAQLRDTVSIEGDKVTLRLRDGRAMSIGGIRDPKFIFGKKLLWWLHQRRLLDLTMGSPPKRAGDLYTYIRESHDDVRREIAQRSAKLIRDRKLYRGGKPNEAAIIAMEAEIEQYCKEHSLDLPGGWDTNTHNTDLKARAGYLVRQVNEWLTTLYWKFEDDIRLRYTLEGGVDITGLPFWCLPIFPVNENGDVDAGLMEWMLKEDKKITEPTKEYLEAPKASLEDLLVMSLISSESDAERQDIAERLRFLTEARLSAFREEYFKTAEELQRIGEIDHIAIAISDGIEDIARKLGAEVIEEPEEGILAIRTDYGIEIIQPIRDSQKEIAKDIIAALEKRGKSAFIHHIAVKARDIRNILGFIRHVIEPAIIKDTKARQNAFRDSVARFYTNNTAGAMLIELTVSPSALPPAAELLDKPQVPTKEEVSRVLLSESHQEAVRAYWEAYRRGDFSEARRIAFEAPLYVTDLPSIPGPREQIVHKEEFEEIVDLPLQEACKILSRKGIKSLSSSANSTDFSKGYASIEIDPLSLSPQNKLIAEELERRGLIERQYPGIWTLKIPIDHQLVTVKELHERACEIVELFELQEKAAAPANRFTQPNVETAIRSYFESLKKLSDKRIYSQPIYAGIFDFPTNEVMQQVPRPAPGTVLAGVGIEQLFSFAVKGKFCGIYHLDYAPRVARVIFPFTGLLFLTADNRAEWLSLLLGVPLSREEAVSLNSEPIDKIRDTLVNKGSDGAYRSEIAKAAATVFAQYIESEQDRVKIEQIIEEFLSHTASELLCPSGQDPLIEQFWINAAYLTNEANYNFVRELWATNHVSGALINIKNPIQLSTVFEEIKSKGLTLGAVYISNISGRDSVIITVNNMAQDMLGYKPGCIIYAILSEDDTSAYDVSETRVSYAPAPVAPPTAAAQDDITKPSIAKLKEDLDGATKSLRAALATMDAM